MACLLCGETAAFLLHSELCDICLDSAWGESFGEDD